MDAKRSSATLERTSEREFVVTRMIRGPARLVFEAWTDAELFRQWWPPKSVPIKLVTCEVDARVGGSYRLVYAMEGAPPMEFVGKYVEVTPCARLVWTNEEGGPDTISVTTVTFEEQGEMTLVVMTERHPSKEALDTHLASGATECTQETFDQLDELICR